MKKFNQSISITVELDQIADQFRSIMNPEAANADLVVEAVISRMILNDINGIGKLFSALNGHRKEIPLEVGKTVKIREGAIRVYGFWTQESIEKNDTVYGNISEVTILELNPYADKEVRVSYMVPKKDGALKEEFTWVSASEFTF